ncbi:MAG: ferritin-like domain-containing protein [Solirubrobacterales bacterium]
MSEPSPRRATRRDALSAGLVAGAGAFSALMAPALLGAGAAFGQAEDTSDTDSELLIGLIGFEQTAVLAYGTALAGGLLDPAVAKRFARQEQAHAGALGAALKKIGGSPPAPPRVEDVPGLTEVQTRMEFLNFAVRLENQQLAAYLEANTQLGSGELLTLSSQIAANEGQHLVILRQDLGTDPIPAPLPSGSESS